MSTISSKIHIEVPAEQLFELLSNPKEVISFIPGGLRVTDVPLLPLKKGDVVKWEFMLLGMPLRGQWMIEEIDEPFFYIAQTQGGVDGRLTYAIVPEGKECELTLTYDYQLPSSLLTRYTMKLIEPHSQGIIDTYLASIKSYLEQSENTSS